MEKSTNQNAGGLPADPLGRPKHGGARLGAGRPRKQKVYAATVGEAEALVAKELPKLLAKYFELAAGVKVQGKSGRNGGEVMYERPPDGKVIADLLNRVMGKPVERVETENIGEEAEMFVIVLPNNGRTDTTPAHPSTPDAGHISRGTS